MQKSHRVRGGLFGNWGRGLLIFSAALLGVAVVATHYFLNKIEATGADLDMSIQRCFIEAPNGLGLEGFSPVSECALFRIQKIHLGPGKIVFDDGLARDANEVSCILAMNRSTSVVRIECNDMAVGKFSTGGGGVDIQSPGENQLRVDVVPYINTSVSRGELSLGDTCAIYTNGYNLTVDGEVVSRPSGKEMTAVFIPYGGVGKFYDKTGGIGLQFTLVDRGFAFDKPLPIAGINFLNTNDQCAGVAGGSIRIGKEKDETVIPVDSCVRLAGQDLLLRHLGMEINSSAMNTALSGRFRWLELNGTKLTGSPTWMAVFIGLGVFLVFGGLILGAKKFLAQGGQL